MAVNTRTRIKDQERSPIVSDLKHAMREKADFQQPTFALTADVSEAHRLLPVHPSDWKFLGCRVEKGGAVCVNTVGTLDISSVSHCWSRVQQPSVVSRRSWLVTHRQPGICWLAMTFTWKPEARITGSPSFLSSFDAQSQACLCRGQRQQGILSIGLDLRCYTGRDSWESLCVVRIGS